MHACIHVWMRRRREAGIISIIFDLYNCKFRTTLIDKKLNLKLIFSEGLQYPQMYFCS